MFVLREVFEFLVPDIVLLTDGGGVVRAALAPVIGADGAVPRAGQDRRRGNAGSRPAGSFHAPSFGWSAGFPPW